MLLEFSCKNHKSIKNEMLFSLLASKDTFNDEYLYDYKDLKILKSSVVYGANGSGKSNFIDAIYCQKCVLIFCVCVCGSPLSSRMFSTRARS